MLNDDLSLLQEAIRLAQEAERSGNLPIGAVIVIDGEVISTGMNAIWQPSLELTYHAEMQALRNIPPLLRPRHKEMTLFTTLEPCLMCAGAILLHQIGRLIFGSSDPYGGIASCFNSLPPYFKQEYSLMQWIGPALPEECDPLYLRIQELEGRRNEGSSSSSFDA